MRLHLLGSNGSIGSAAEGAGTFDNSDACGNNTSNANPGPCVYGNPATLVAANQTFTGLSTDTTAANTTMTASAVLDSMTRLKRNRAPLINGGYVLATDPRVARDLMRDALFTLAMLVVFLANLLSMGEWYRFASDRNLSTELFSGVLFAILVAGVCLEVALAVWWLA